MLAIRSVSRTWHYDYMPMTPPDIILMLRLKLYSSLSKRTCPRCLHGSDKIYSELITLSLKL